MAQVFRPWTNGVTRLILWGSLSVIIIGLAVWIALPRSTWDTLIGRAVAQPVPFSHQHHVAGLGLDCRYCHTGVEKSSFAGIPATEVCMTCHSQIWTEAEILEPVRQSYATGERLVWNRVHNLADFVFFNHAIHVNNGVACAECHGRVDTMPLTWRAESLHMQWCLGCHRDPSQRLRPQDAITAMDWTPTEPRDQLAARLMEEYDIHPENLTDCYVCHR